MRRDIALCFRLSGTSDHLALVLHRVLNDASPIKDEFFPVLLFVQRYSKFGERFPSWNRGGVVPFGKHRSAALVFKSSLIAGGGVIPWYLAQPSQRLLGRVLIIVEGEHARHRDL